MTIYLTDQEIARELGVESRQWQTVIAPALEREGLPRRDALFDDKRCWPAVLEFLMKRAGCNKDNIPGVKFDGFKRAKEDTRNTRVKNTTERQRRSATVLDLQQARREVGVRTESHSGSPD